MQHALSDVVSPVNDGFDHHIRIHTKELPHKKIHTNEKPHIFLLCRDGYCYSFKGSSDAHFPQVDMIL